MITRFLTTRRAAQAAALASIDPDRAPRVPTRVSRSSKLALVLAAALPLAVGCGGKSKGAETPAGSAATDPAGMGSNAPVGTGAVDSYGNPIVDAPAAGGDSGSDTGAVAPGDGGAVGEGGEPAPEPIRPPNLDPDPAVAARDVNVKLTSARAALSAATPDPDKALADARAALAIDATSVDAVVVMAHAYVAKKLYSTAEVILDMMFKDREVSRSNPGVYYVYGLIYDAKNEDAKAFAAYKKSVELAPNYKSALVNLGVHYLQNKQYDEALSIYEKLTGSLGLSTDVTLTNLGSAYRGKSGDYQAGDAPRGQYLLKAEEAYKRAVSANKNYGPAYYNLGLLYLDGDPFPQGGAAMDTLVRLQRAKTYFDEYRQLPGANQTLLDEQVKQVDKLIKREEKMRKKKEQG